MKPIPKSAERPQIPERRRFLRTVLFTGAALASGCKSPNKDSTATARVFQNRPFPLGNSSLTLKGCSDSEQTATFEVSKPGGAGLPDSVTLRVPGSFPTSVSRNIDVESISCGTSQKSADVSISTESEPAENPGNAQRLFADLPAIGAAIAFFGTLVFLVVHRRKPEESGGILFGSKRQQQNHNHLITP